MKTLVIYKDLIVREYKELNEDILVDSIGVIRGNESDRSYTPTKYNGGYHDYSVNLWNWSIVNDEIIINDYFKIIKIEENPHYGNHYSYWRELTITLKDSFSSIKSFKFEIDPKSLFTYNLIQKYLLEVKEELEDNNSFEMLEINNENKQLKTSLDSMNEENLKLTEHNDELIKENEELIKRITELENRLEIISEKDDDNSN